MIIKYPNKKIKPYKLINLSKHMQTSKTGFTLIELLVVIAIIGILAGMVVINMQGAPNSAKDATIRGYMAQMRAAAMIFNTSNNTYVGIDGTGQEYRKLMDQVDVTNGSAVPVTSVTATAYCYSTALVVSGSWCIDSTGAVGTSTCSTTDSKCH
jgi:prepilin-type N-terminal cleavage/methylation domain-containing protein